MFQNIIWTCNWSCVLLVHILPFGKPWTEWESKCKGFYYYGPSDYLVNWRQRDHKNHNLSGKGLIIITVFQLAIKNYKQFVSKQFVYVALSFHSMGLLES